MFRDIRRKKQVLSEQECLEILAGGEWGVLGVHGDDGYPYTVPLNYVFHEGAIYFHSARSGHKIDAIEHDDKASFCVVAESDLVPEEFATAFKSVIAFGRIRKVEDQEAKMAALTALVETLTGQVDPALKRAELETCEMRDNVEILVLEPEHISGKQAKCLARKAHG